MILKTGLALLGLVLAAAAYCLIRRLADREMQSWAGPVASAVAWGGIDFAYDPPWWVTLVGFVIVCVVIHYFLRSKLRDKAWQVDKVEVPRAGLSLRRVPDPSNRYVALWTSAPAIDGTPQARPPLNIALSFVGETEDEYEVVLWAQTPREMPGSFLAHYGGAVGDFKVLLDTEPVTGILGQPTWLCVRASPSDYAFRLLDFKTLSVVIDIINFRSAEREVYIYLQGHKMGIGSTRVFGEGELRRLLPLAAELFLRGWDSIE